MRYASLESMLDAVLKNAQGATHRQHCWDQVYALFNCELRDADGNRVGTIHGIWPDEDGAHHEFVGIDMDPLSGLARAVPVVEMEVDPATCSIRVPYKREHIRGAPRFSIARRLAAEHKRGICTHYRLETSKVPSLAGTVAAGGE